MRCLVDTHVLLWWLFDDPRLSATVREILGDSSNEILVSAASGWEITTKHRLGKLRGAEELASDVEGWVRRAAFRQLPVTLRHGQRAGGWLVAHRDPFDRMLAAQSELEELPLVTRDPDFTAFGIATIW